MARRLHNAPLDYEPENEQGVVYLFATIARKEFGLHVQPVKQGYPDCIATLRGERVRIEFEYRSRNFAQHGHPPKGCDWIVCWIHDWPDVPKRLRVVELRRLYGLGFHVWLMPVSGDWIDEMDVGDWFDGWSVPPKCGTGDLVLYYRTRPHQNVTDLFEVTGPPERTPAAWKRGTDTHAPIERVARLDAPLHLSELRDNKVLRTAGFVRAGMRGRYDVSEYWPELHRMIVKRNPSVRAILKPYGPDRL